MNAKIFKTLQYSLRILLILFVLVVIGYIIKQNVSLKIVKEEEIATPENYTVLTDAARNGFYDISQYQNNSSRSVIFFTSTWCGPCDYFSTVMRSQANVYPDIAFYEVDIDQNRDLAEEFNVSLTPSLVFIDEASFKVKTRITSEKIQDHLNFFSSGGTFNL